MALTQAIGRWGNYFNQELFGTPTALPWGIPIELNNRLLGYYHNEYFHPTFLYESIGNLLIFIFLFFFHKYIIKNKLQQKENTKIFIILSLSYLILYSTLRFFTEFIRIDPTPTIWIFRLPQIVSLLIILVSALYLYKIKEQIKKSTKADKSS